MKRPVWLLHRVCCCISAGRVGAEGLVAAHKAAQLRPAAAAGGGGEEDGGEEEVDLDAFVEAPEIDMDDL